MNNWMSKKLKEESVKNSRQNNTKYILKRFLLAKHPFSPRFFSVLQFCFLHLVSFECARIPSVWPGLDSGPVLYVG